MKCTGNKWISMRFAALAAAGALFLYGCGTKDYELEHPYDVYGTSIRYVQQQEEDGTKDLAVFESVPYFAQQLCVGEPAPMANAPDASAVEAAGVFHLEEGSITYAKNMHKKLYPASTTKILTAYTALKHADLDDIVTVSAAAASQAGDSSVCGLKAGDQLTLEELLYGLLLESGNDAADAIAEHVSGSSENFAALMNEEAAKIPAGCYGMYCTFSDVMNYICWKHAAPTFTNFALDPDKFNRYTFYRAIMENSAMATKGNIELVASVTGELPKEIIFASGASKSPLWCQIVSDVLNIPVHVPQVKEATALGAAILAGKGVGIYTDIEETMKKVVKIEKTYYPNEENAKVYQDLYDKWRKVYAAQLALANEGLTKNMWSAPGV